MIVIALDPGIRGCGLAILRDTSTGVMVMRGEYVRNPVKQGNDPYACVAMVKALCDVIESFTHGWINGDRGLWDVVVEWPRIYDSLAKKGDKAAADPNDLLPLCGVDIGLCMRIPHARHHRLYPSDWKGTIPKNEHDIVKNRVIARLSITERAALIPAPASVEHNMYDALGIGLKFVGRFDPVKVFAR